MKQANIQIYNKDCLLAMREMEDNEFDLAIVDPPYGINRSKNFGMKKFGWVQHKRTDWDNKIPTAEYFEQLFRISKNQIIWGGNYMVEYLKPSMGWVFWDKGQRNFSTSDGELAYSSFQRKLKVLDLNRRKTLADNGGVTIHPTQKPVALYKWLLKNYAEPGQTILDTHGGSMSFVIACAEMGFDIICCELDKDYFEAAVKRVKDHIKQLNLFAEEPKVTIKNELNGKEI